MSAITSLAPWFGGKRTMAAQIVEQLGPHRSYWEIFCGSMSVLLSKQAVSTETVNDLHGDLINLARVLKDEREGPKLYRRLRRTLCSEAEFRDSLVVVREATATTPADRAYHYFVTSWQGLNGVAGTSTTNTNFARRFTSQGGAAAKRWDSVVRSIPAWRARLRSVQVLEGDGIELAKSIEDRESTVIYADPPYLVKGASYLHDFTNGDHARLAQALNRFKATRVVVSYYDHPKLQDLYPGWTKLRIDVAKGLVNSAKRPKGRTEAPEVLLINGDPVCGKPSLFDESEVTL